ncbi:stalk domain-containing protein [Paenibacillus sp. SN-8-1]|uniref:stalk domain-containing protein n=1 Tax=Paenibacillus sp. SN-8-1 TaxID=3435409 RepID=UPI003D9A7FD0
MKKVIAALALGMMIGSTTVALAAPSTVQATITKFRMIVNGQLKSSTSTQLVYKGTTYVPIRETAKYFGYNTFYNPHFDSIEFTQKNKISNKWSTLIEFTNLNDYEILPSDDSSVLTIGTPKNVAFKITTSVLKEGSETTVITTNGKLLHVLYSNSTLFLNKEDLKAAGYNI